MFWPPILTAAPEGLLEIETKELFSEGRVLAFARSNSASDFGNVYILVEVFKEEVHVDSSVCDAKNCEISLTPVKDVSISIY